MSTYKTQPLITKLNTAILLTARRTGTVYGMLGMYICEVFLLFFFNFFDLNFMPPVLWKGNVRVIAFVFFVVCTYFCMYTLLLKKGSVYSTGN